ncbi:nucleotide-binding universal stress UspA family protein [Variovorax boronicumulans]|uniref:universal stress protein n=1 Tax=Variovorax boronicumulans TaxID=436515 RepID=UPI0027841947|nr:universal stress protein [Variovorax boronicumulans]MDQ0036863.1 nucleotide-binding universal stress UspA family protein [Variovorax boronicumulans]
MTLSTISVHLDHTERCEVRTLLAARIARLHRSHLIGIVPTGCGPASPPPPTQEKGDVLVEASLYLRRRAETVAHVFRCRIKGLAPLSCGARLVDGDPAQAVVHHGRASDLVIVGQADSAAVVGDATRRLPEEVMLNVGRPVLVIPREGRIAHAFVRILVAWDGSREASIALRAALPLLRKAAHVTLLSLVRGGETDAVHAPNPSEMSGWLLRHGVQANVERAATSLRFVDALRARVEVSEADLLVMGGYGHARLRERMLGGATHDVLARAAVPVLMAH